MRIVFALALAGAMVSTGFAPVRDSEFTSTATARLATTGMASLDSKPITDRFPAPPEPAKFNFKIDPVSADRYPVGEDPMVDSMIKTNRSVLAAPIPEVPMGEVCEALATAAEEHGLPVAFLARLIWQESRFRQSAVSPVGAQGVAQFMPRTADAYGLENPFDPVEALSASARFLRELRDTFGNLGLAAAAYNGGSGRVQNWLARRNKLPEETRNYVKIITGHEPEKWTVASASVDLAVNLPQRAPCEGIAGLARDNEPQTVSVALADWVGDTIRKAEAAEAAARVAAAKAKLVARAKGSKKSHEAKSKGKALVAAKSGKSGKDGKKGTAVAAKSGKAKDKPVKAAAAKTSKKASKVAGKSSNKSIKMADARRR